MYINSVPGPNLAIGENILERRWNITKTPKLVISGAKHFSWQKSAVIAITGIWASNIIPVSMDIHARMSITHLRTILTECLDTRQPVYSVVGIVGTTQEGAVDPLYDILVLRDEFAAKGLTFTAHADVAWGGYFATMIPRNVASIRDGVDSASESNVSFGLRAEKLRHISAMKDVDSVMVDPHNTGYVPYPAGGLCYRDGRMRYLLTWTAPYVEEGFDEHIGAHGVEGSKPGAAATAV